MLSFGESDTELHVCKYQACICKHKCEGIALEKLDRRTSTSSLIIPFLSEFLRSTNVHPRFVKSRLLRYRYHTVQQKELKSFQF